LLLEIGFSGVSFRVLDLKDWWDARSEIADVEESIGRVFISSKNIYSQIGGCYAK
jgi:hypothetical protein